MVSVYFETLFLFFMDAFPKVSLEVYLCLTVKIEKKNIWPYLGIIIYGGGFGNVNLVL